jgi:hypothetical protein
VLRFNAAAWLQKVLPVQEALPPIEPKFNLPLFWRKHSAISYFLKIPLFYYLFLTADFKIKSQFSTNFKTFSWFFS